MATHDSLQDRLSRESELTLSVMGRKSHKWIPRPVWFVVEDNNLYLLPVQGSDTEWYKNLLENPNIKVKAGTTEDEFQATPITDRNEVIAVVEKFRHKYGTGDVKKYYTKFDVAVVVPIVTM